MDRPAISLGFPPGPHALEAADVAEAMGYERLWLYDSAAIWEDVHEEEDNAEKDAERAGVEEAEGRR